MFTYLLHQIAWRSPDHQRRDSVPPDEQKGGGATQRDAFPAPPGALPGRHDGGGGCRHHGHWLRLPAGFP